MTDRREFLCSIGRVGALAGLSALAWVLVSGESSCDLAGRCRGCARLVECDRPEAETERKTKTPKLEVIDG